MAILGTDSQYIIKTKKLAINLAFNEKILMHNSGSQATKNSNNALLYKNLIRLLIQIIYNYACYTEETDKQW